MFTTNRVLRLVVIMLAFIISVWGTASIKIDKKIVKIYNKPSKKSKILKKLKKGTVLSAIKRQGMYWQIKLKDGQTGFVSILKVKYSQKVNNQISDVLNSFIKTGRREKSTLSTRTRSAVMGVRGLAESDVSKAGEIIPDLKLVYQMEDLKISHEKIKKFSKSILKELEKRMK